jgi:RNA polymerase sigma factor (sigma-70 family)
MSFGTTLSPKNERSGAKSGSATDVQYPKSFTPPPSQRALLNERAVELAQMLQRLPEEQREAVRLRHLEGWSLVRIAEHLGRSKAATVGLIKRGMQKLREYLKPAP